ncbi:MAG: Trk system potassium transport protein TrkA [Spirochaetaceae bacterium]|jgi:trk system potassium uptake protein TrkA|nr:Trk system potassium transport protein TrkA [Spirochaetaceae bacterium]
MRVIIVGAGTVGTQLARHLTREKNEVSLIESNEEHARHASNRLDCLVINNEGNSRAVLEEAGIARADALICVTSSDEINMIICGIAAESNPALIKIARVKNDDYFSLKRSGSFSNMKNTFTQDAKLLGIDHFVHPNIEASQSALNAIDHNAAGDILSFAGTDYELGSIEVARESPFDGLALKDYRTLVPGNTLVTLVEREDECILPSGSTVLKSGDRVFILAQEEDMDKLFEMGNKTERPFHTKGEGRTRLRRKEKVMRKIGIVGGGQLGALIADGLFSRGAEEQSEKSKSLLSVFKGFIKKNNRKIFIIEQDYALCKELSAQFPHAVVLNEDISDENFVVEEQLNDLDLIVTATGNQELNIITALYLKSRGVKRAIVMVANDGYARIAKRLGIDVVIPVKSVIVDSILSNLMSGGVRGIHRLGNGAISIFEIEIDAASPLAEKPITAFHISEGALLMLVERGKSAFIPHGDYIFSSGDKIVIITKKDSEKEMEKYFGVRL